MEKKKRTILSAMVLTFSLTTACSSKVEQEASVQTPEVIEETKQEIETIVTSFTGNASGMLDTTNLFTERDLTQTADLSQAVSYTVSDNQNIQIEEEGVYVLQGSASNVTVTVAADDNAKVQIVLDGVSITNSNAPAIYVKNADKVFVTTVQDSTLQVTGDFVSDGQNDLDAVIYSCDDLVLNGTAALTIQSTSHGVKSKDDLKITGGTYHVTANGKGFSAHDSIRIVDGTFVVNAQTDAFHAEDDDDSTVGYIYIAGGQFQLSVGDDAIHATTVFQMDGGDIVISSSVEGIEATYVQINGGSISIATTDDGINASHKSDVYNPTIEINGGEITVTTASGDTDGVDSNGDFIMNGGTLNLNISGMSSIDYDGNGSYNGGTIIVNGTTISDLSAVADQMGMMQGPGGMPQGPGGMPPGHN